ncbi:hypothetical protein B4N87_13175 [Acinetobacter baumannii]|nr:hypothetical protein B4N87_13175 [Acinetobacter baumannii]
MEGIHLLYLEINKIFSLSCQPICNSALHSLSFQLGQWPNFFVFILDEASFHYADFVIDS